MSQINLKRIISFVVVLMLVVSCATASADTVRLSVQGIADRTYNLESRRVDRPVITAFSEAFPNVKLNLSAKNSFQSTRALLRALEQRKLTSDVFTVATEYHNLADILSSGYCLDLTDNPDVVALLSEMHPAIAAAAQIDGHIYGVPVGISTLRNLIYDQDALALVGYTNEDVPTSFTGLLDFLDGWIERIRVNPVDNVCVTNAFSEEAINESSYTLWLMDILLRSYVYQCEVTGAVLSFDDPTLLALFERVKEIGAELYQYDQFRTAKSSLFQYLSDSPQLIPRVIPTRLSDADPIFIPATITLACINANSKHPEMAQAFVIHYVDWMRQHTTDAYGILENFHDEKMTYTDDDYWAEFEKAMLFQNVVGPIHSRNVNAVTNIPRMIADYQKRLDDTKSEERRVKIRSDLDILTSPGFKEECARTALDFTEDELTAYRAMTSYLFFASPDLFSPDSKDITRLCMQYAMGTLTCQEFAQKLNKQLLQQGR